MESKNVPYDKVEVSKRSKYLNYIVYTVLGIIGCSIGVFMFWLVTGDKALDVSNSPVPVQPKFVKSLEEITISVDFCKSTDAHGRVVRKLVSDKTELLAPVVVESVEPGCYKNLQIKIPIPDQTPPGRYKVVYRITYQTNPIKNIVEEFESQEFDVVDK